MTLEADIIIAGAGAAGLSLAGALAHPARRLRVLVLEPRALSDNPRRWVFPAEPGHALTRHVSASFDAVTFAGAERPLSKVRLFHVPAQAVQAEALERLAGAPDTRLEQQVRIDALVNEGRSVRLETSLGTARARLFVDTRPAGGGAVAGRAWTQIAWIALAQGDPTLAPGFTLSAAFSDHGGVGFDQTLVLPGGEILVEAVRLARPGDQGEGLTDRLAARLVELGADPASALRRRLVVPLDPGETDTARGAVLFARAGAGGLRFGPGVEAVRLARWAEAAAARFASGGRIVAPPGPRAPARAAARKVLRQLEAGPEPAAHWLNAMLARLAPDAALRFLAGAPGWRDSPALFVPARQSA